MERREPTVGRSCTEPWLRQGRKDSTEPQLRKGRKDPTEPYLRQGKKDPTEPQLRQGRKDPTEPQLRQGRKDPTEPQLSIERAGSILWSLDSRDRTLRQRESMQIFLNPLNYLESTIKPANNTSNECLQKSGIYYIYWINEISGLGCNISFCWSTHGLYYCTTGDDQISKYFINK